MKKNTKLLVLSLTSLMGLGLMGCDMAKAIPTTEKPEPQVIQDEATETDAIGERVKLNQDPNAPVSSVTFSPAFGYQIFNETAEKMSIRLFAVINNYKGLSAAKITSKVTSYREDKAVAPADETIVKEETEFQVTTVYSSIKAASEVTWSETVSAADFPSPYYMVYTLNNIPAAHYFDTISLTFSATADSEQTKGLVFNAMGLHGDYSKNIKYEENDGADAGTYKAFKQTAGYNIKKVFLPQKHVQITDFYAKPLGDIVALNPGTTTGVFESWTGLEEIHLPDTIKTVGGWAFASSSLKKINLPASLANVGSTIFSNYTKLTELDYECANLVNASNTYSVNVELVKVSANVESLPEKFFNSAYGATKIVYEGTEAQWAALKTDSNAENGFFIDNVYCSDTTTSTVTYHYGDGKIGEVTGDVETTAINGHLLKNPGNPIPNEEGKEFKGWFTDANFQTPADFTAAVSGDVDLYAKYDDFGPGISMDNPTLLDPNSPESFSANLVPGKKAEYMKFTMPATAAHGDWYYLSIDSSASTVAADISSTSYKNPGITVYDGNKQEITLGSDKISDASKAQKVDSDAGKVRFYAEPGESYYFKAALHTSASSEVYGTMALKLENFDNDNEAEAINLTFGNHVAVNNLAKHHHIVYKYVATETKSIAVYKTQTNYEYGGFNVVDAANPTELIGSYNKSSSGFLVMNQEAGHTYLIEAFATNPATEDSFISIYVDEAPQGSNQSNPIALTLGDEVTVADVGSQYVYYSFSLAEESTVKFLLSGGNSSYAKSVEVLSTSIKVEETGKKTTSWGETTITYGGEVSTINVLPAGDYLVKVGYAEPVSYWTSFKFKAMTIGLGDDPTLPREQAITMDTNIQFESAVNGIWYRINSDAANYLNINYVAASASGIKVALYSVEGTTKLKEVTTVGGTLVYQTAADTDYLLLVHGADGNVTLNMSRSDTAETGLTKAEAFTAKLGMADMKNVSDYAGSTIWLKFTTTEAGLYKVFTRSYLDGQPAPGNGNDANIYGLYTADSDTAVTATKAPVDDDRHSHPETAGNYDSYGEYTLEAGTTYYVKLKVGSTNASNWDNVYFGVKGSEPGDNAAAAITADLSGASFEATATESGYWYKYTSAATESLTITPSGLEGAKVTVYKSDGTTSLGEVSVGAAEGLTVLITAGDYYVRVSGASGTLTLALEHSEAPAYTITNQKGTGGDKGAISNLSAGEGWIEDTDHEGVLKSNIYGIGMGRAVYNFSVSVDGHVSFKYACSGEKGWDYLCIYVNGTELVGKDQSVAPVGDYDSLAWTDFERDLHAGDSLVIVYQKDNSGNGGLDTAFIKNFNFAAAE